MTASFTLSAFGDEIASELDEQLTVLNELNVPNIDFRGAWGTNIKDLTDEQVQRAKSELDAHGIQVACLGSPVGKSPIEDPIERELATLERLAEIGSAFDCTRVRIFSFYPPNREDNSTFNQYVEESIERLGKLSGLAAREGLTLVLENEKEVTGDVLARCEKLLKGVNSPNLRFAWDSANFVQCGEQNVVDRGWPMVRDYVSYVHIKDAKLADGSVVVSGAGDGQIPELMQNLIADDYQGILALEPHLLVAGHSGGFTGADLMGKAVQALRDVMKETGAQEVDSHH
ncbi:MAG: sugar phosphate isomerase/epimerase [Anaerolineae bacterium]|nr:sugar phosphate isomerase/epimerase [Anaerolineae bacterium]